MAKYGGSLVYTCIALSASGSKCWHTLVIHGPCLFVDRHVAFVSNAKLSATLSCVNVDRYSDCAIQHA